MAKLEKREKWLIALVVFFLVLTTLLTKFEGGADTFDYQDVSRFFAVEYNAKIRTSHSYLYGFIHAPFVGLLNNFLIFKISSLAFLLLIIYSVYLISGKNKKTLWLTLLSPIVWYMAPWASPIQLSSLLFLWSFHFIRRYDSEKENLKSLFFSGLLIGLSWAFWDAILFFIPLFIISFLHNKKFLHSVYFTLFLVIGVLPKLILDQAIFGFALFTTIRHVMASLALTFLGGFYGQGGLWGFSSFLLVVVFLPIFTYLIFRKDIFRKNKKTVIFLSLSIILLLINSQTRFVLLIVPLITLTIHDYLDKKKYAIQIVFSIILILLVLNPYVLQSGNLIGDNSKGIEFTYLIRNLGDFSPEDKFQKSLLKLDLDEISKEIPGETFVIGNFPDSYRILANIYWGEDIKEFVSIEDYGLNAGNNTPVAERTACTNSKIANRRDFCASIWITKAFGDGTNYEKIRYGISFEESLDLEGFEFIKKYEKLSLFKKTSQSL